MRPTLKQKLKASIRKCARTIAIQAAQLEAWKAEVRRLRAELTHTNKETANE